MFRMVEGKDHLTKEASQNIVNIFVDDVRRRRKTFFFNNLNLPLVQLVSEFKLDLKNCTMGSSKYPLNLQMYLYNNPKLSGHKVLEASQEYEQKFKSYLSKSKRINEKIETFKNPNFE